MTTPDPVGRELASRPTPSNAVERAETLTRLWQAMPSHLTATLPPHTIDFVPARDGHGLEATAHQWGPLRVSLRLERGGTITIKDGTNTLTGQPLPIKTLLDIADTVQEALANHPDHGPVIRAIQAVAYQTFGRSNADEVAAAEADADRVTHSLRALMGPVAFHADPHNETDNGDSWALVRLADFNPSQLHPGALVRADLAGVVVRVSIRGTQLHDRTNGEPTVLVTYRPLD